MLLGDIPASRDNSDSKHQADFALMGALHTLYDGATIWDPDFWSN
jgi:hypothetical protein